jgi:hypothetical protein
MPRPKSQFELRSQRGQTAVEYLGVIAVVVALIGGMLALSPRIGQEIGCKILEKIGAGGGCGSGGLIGDDGQPKTPCVVADSDGKIKASLTVFSVKGGGEVKILKQKRSDGKTVVTVSGGANLGLKFGAGADANVDVGKSSVGGGAGVEGGAALQGEGGASWIFNSDKEADDFIGTMRDKLRDSAIEAAAPGIGDLGVALFGNHDSIPDPDIVYIQGGVGGNVKGEAKLGGGLEGGLEGAAVLGGQWNRKTGEKTIYYRVNAKGEGSAKLLAGLGLSASGEVQLSVTYDKDGHPIKASIQGKGGVAGGIPKLEGKDPVSWLKSVSFGGQEGARLEANFDLDLTDPANRQAFEDFLHNPISGADDLGKAFLDRGLFSARLYKTDQSKYGVSADAALGLKFGIEGGYEGNDSSLMGAWYYDRSTGGFKEWTDCTGG